MSWQSSGLGPRRTGTIRVGDGAVEVEPATGDNCIHHLWYPTAVERRWGATGIDHGLGAAVGDLGATSGWGTARSNTAPTMQPVATVGSLHSRSRSWSTTMRSAGATASRLKRSMKGGDEAVRRGLALQFKSGDYRALAKLMPLSQTADDPVVHNARSLLSLWVSTSPRQHQFRSCHCAGMDWTTMSSLYGNTDDYRHSCIAGA